MWYGHVMSRPCAARRLTCAGGNLVGCFIFWRFCKRKPHPCSQRSSGITVEKHSLSVKIKGFGWVFPEYRFRRFSLLLYYQITGYLSIDYLRRIVKVSKRIGGEFFYAGEAAKMPLPCWQSLLKSSITGCDSIYCPRFADGAKPS